MLRVDGYIRVSRVGYRGGERFISPSVQRQQIEAWAESRRAELLEVWEELDESGARADRPLLEAAIQRIERGASQGLVVAKTDRFGRSLIDGLRMIERIEQAGGTFWSVLDGFDLATDTGRLVLRIMLSMAEFERDRRTAEWDTAKARAIQRGAFMGAYVPPGYRKTRAGRLRPDPRTAPVIVAAFRLRAAGATAREVCEFLEAHEVRTGKGNTGWSTTSLTRALGACAYRGAVRYGPYVNDHAHVPLVDAATWEAALRPRCPRRLPRHGQALLAAMVRCAGCGMTMSAGRRRQGDREVFWYACRRHFAAGSCPSPAHISSLSLDPCVERIALDLLRRRRRPPLGEVRSAEERVSVPQESLARYRDSDRVLSALGENTFAAGLAARVDRLHQAQLGLAAARDRVATHELPSVVSVRANWESMSVAEHRDIIERLVDVIFVTRGGDLPLSERVTVCPAGTAPADLPRSGDKRPRLRQYSRRRRWVSPIAERQPTV